MRTLINGRQGCQSGNNAQSLWGIVPILLRRARFGGVSGTLFLVVGRLVQVAEQL